MIWKTSPDGARACGSNTSSPCVAKGRVFFGTTAGRLHILDAASGKIQKSIDVGWPITGSPTWANDSLYFKTWGRSSIAWTWTATNAGAGTTTRPIRIPRPTNAPADFLAAFTIRITAAAR